MANTNKPVLTEQQQVFWILVQKINNCWYQGRPTDLLDYFHQDVVFNSPDFKHQITSKENCVQTYTDFMNISSVIDYIESSPNIRIFEKTAIVTYDFEMKYEQKDKTYHEIGTDILVFGKDGQSWKVIWRAMSNLKNV
ncbi:MAG: nuclear transport factor 2 family protein [Edaphocola sp.]